jgi:4-amino-4-deoxy-L-arabinose transferase-like glycosyltransferase
MNSAYSFKNIGIFLLFVILIIFPLTEFLDALPIYLWDESRQADNAMEMYENHNWLVTHYDGTPDMWNTKPPLLIWLQVICLHLFGFTATAIRAPSVIAAIATAIAIFFFMKKNTGNVWIGFFSGIALVSMPGFNGFHVSRTGDYDSLLILFSTLSIIQFYYYVDTLNRKHILLFTLFLCLGSLTKGVAALLFIPGLFLYVVLQKKMLALLKDPFFYLSCLGYIIIVGSYYFSREYVNPGYLQAVYDNELGGRYLKINEGHDGNAFSYITSLYSEQTYFWFFLFLLGILVYPFCLKTLSTKKLFYYFLVLSSCFIAVISSSKTIITWYSAPILPLLACATILLLITALSFIAEKIKPGFSLKNNWILYVIGLIVLIGYLNIIKINHHPSYKYDWDKDFYRLSSFFHENKYPVSELNLKIIDDTKIHQHLQFYIKRLQYLNPAIDFGDYKKLKKGDSVITDKESISEYIKHNYAVSELYKEDGIYLYRIN